jgi:hypothetical protein
MRTLRRVPAVKRVKPAGQAPCCPLRGLVVGTDDPLGQGRLLVEVPLLGLAPFWAEVVQPLPGAWVQWPAGAEVLVTAEAGDWARPVVLGLMRGGGEALVLALPGGGEVRLEAGGWELRDGFGNRLVLGPAGVKLEAASGIEMTASQAQVSASVLTVDAGMARFSGVVQAETVITQSVVSASYTPGAGNIW